ncbi:MAG TPA: lysophospholipid acyltransferase family protein, partial [Rectinemataceae bacterium]|nr:lysophospholipid acyltransferase family protein [Rectinemataceae bacterium]
MAYKRGDPLIERKAMFLAASKAITWFIEIVGWPIIRLLYGFRVQGRENLKAAGITAGRKGRKSHIIVSNHSLPLDPLLHALSLLPRFTYFTLLEETVLTPVLGTLVRFLGGIPVPHDSERLIDIEAAVGEGLKGRGLVHFYPEGECFLLSQEIGPFKAGAFYYAIKFGVPVLPIVTLIRPRAGRA